MFQAPFRLNSFANHGDCDIITLYEGRCSGLKTKQINAEIIAADDLPGDLQYALSASPDYTVRKDQSIYLLTGHKVIVFPDEPDINSFLQTVTWRGGRQEKPVNATGLFRRLLTDNEFTPDAALYRECGTRADKKRCVVLFRSYGLSGKDLYTVFTSIAPIEKSDIVFPVDYQSAVLIRETDRQEAEDLIDFTDAVIGSMEGEGITGIKAGIGREAETADKLRTSYRDALNALSVGNIYHSQDSVYVYEKQTLERIVDSIPAEMKKQIRDEFRQIRAGETFSDEMLETVRVFFMNDLNLTAASRQLFIHRNTLNYRLDKIRKISGLDLRKFHDAVIFSVIALIPQEQ